MHSVLQAARCSGSQIHRHCLGDLNVSGQVRSQTRPPEVHPGTLNQALLPESLAPQARLGCDSALLALPRKRRGRFRLTQLQAGYVEAVLPVESTHGFACRVLDNLCFVRTKDHFAARIADFADAPQRPVGLTYLKG